MVFFWLVYKDAYKRTNAREVKAVTVANKRIENVEGVEDVTGLLRRRAMKVDKVHFKGWFLAPVASRTDDADWPGRTKDETLGETLARMKKGETLRDVMTHETKHGGESAHYHLTASKGSSRPNSFSTSEEQNKAKQRTLRASSSVTTQAETRFGDRRWPSKTSTTEFMKGRGRKQWPKRQPNEDQIEVSYGEDSESNSDSYSATSDLYITRSSMTRRASNAGKRSRRIHWPRRRRSPSPDEEEDKISFGSESGSNSGSNSAGEEASLTKTSRSVKSHRSSTIHWPRRHSRSPSPKPAIVSFGDNSQSDSESHSTTKVSVSTTGPCRSPSHATAPMAPPSNDDDSSWSAESSCSTEKSHHKRSRRRQRRRCRSVSPEPKREILVDNDGNDTPSSPDGKVAKDNFLAAVKGSRRTKETRLKTHGWSGSDSDSIGSSVHDEGSVSRRNSAIEAEKPEASTSFSFCEQTLDVDTSAHAAVPKPVRIVDRSIDLTRQPERGCMKVSTLEDSLAATFGSSSHKEKHVEFENIIVREHVCCLGDNPACSSGPPISLSWEYNPQNKIVSIDEYEHHRRADGHIRRQESDLVISRERREEILSRLGYTDRAITKASMEKRQIQIKREETIHKLKYMRMEERMERLKQCTRCMSPCCLLAKRGRSVGLIQ